jgi:hypothetical protein
MLAVRIFPGSDVGPTPSIVVAARVSCGQPIRVLAGTDRIPGEECDEILIGAEHPGNGSGALGSAGLGRQSENDTRREKQEEERCDEAAADRL